MAAESWNNRYFIVTFGRSGSSLLCHILQQAGAAFGLPRAAPANTFSSHLEHPTIEFAVKAAHAANAYDREGPLGLGKLGFNLWRSIAKMALKRALRSAVYSKSRRNTSIIPIVTGLGYTPKLIIMYRRYGDIIVSDIEKSKNAPSYYLKDLVQTYSDAQFLLHRFGGLIVDFDEVIDNTKDQWITRLAELTGLETSVLAERRAALVKAHYTTPRHEVYLPAELEELEAFYRRNVNIVFEPASVTDLLPRPYA